MAKKVVFSRDLILQKAFDFVMENGIDALSARELGKYIGCSTQPLFKAFVNMDDIKKNLINYMSDYYDKFSKDIINDEEYIFTKNYSYIKFALDEPNIFKALFMDGINKNQTIDEWLNSRESIEKIELIAKKMFIPNKQARRLYRDVFFYCHGIACQIAYRNISLSENDIKILIRNIIRQFSQSMYS